MKKRFFVGLTGGIGSGKSTVAQLFAQFNIAIIDADAIAKTLLMNNPSIQQKVIDHFGASILTRNNLDRKKLQHLVFNDPNALTWLEQLLHPLVIEEIQQQKEQIQSPYAIIMIPLLIEKNLQFLVDRILLVDSSEQHQIQRTQARDQLHEKIIKRIIETQASRQAKRALAGDVIENNATLAELKQQVLQLHEKYLDQT